MVSVGEPAEGSLPKLVEPEFSKKRDTFHMCLKTGQASFGCVLSAVSKVASGAFRSWLSVTAGVGVLMVSGLSGTSGVLHSSMSPGRAASVEYSNQCHGVPVPRYRS